MLKFNIMEYIYALKVNEKEENFFAFYSTLDKAKSAGKEWLKKTNKIWYNPVTYVGMTCYELGLDIHKIQFDTIDNDNDYGTHIIAAFNRRASEFQRGKQGLGIITEEQPSWT